MAKPKTEPVNSEQLEALEAQAQPGPQTAAAGAPTAGELEERTVEAEEKAAGLARENEELKATLATMEAQIAAIKAQMASAPRRKKDEDDDEELGPDGVPVFDETAPHGVVVGDTLIAYVQNGYQFGRDRQFIKREAHRGVPRAFNPKLVGWVKPRPGAANFDPFEGIRDRTW